MAAGNVVVHHGPGTDQAGVAVAISVSDFPQSSPPTDTVSDDASTTPRRSPTTDAARRVLLGRLPIEDTPLAIARRIRTAIGIGVLTDGEKLPKESDLAHQFGVTAFSLREALSLLRNEGLIVTRVGKHGGSFVLPPPPEGAMAGDELIRLTATELRDLGDWQTALTTFSAHMAARKESRVAAEQLRGCAEEMARAVSSLTARRALGRFHIELSAAAQSIRLTRAELTVHQEFAWLSQVLLQHNAHRQAVAAAMTNVATAVGAGDPEASWHAAEQSVSYLVTELSKVRLQLIAAHYGSSQPQGADRPPDLQAGICQLLEPLLHVLEQVAAEVATVFEQSPDARTVTGAVARSVLPRLPALDQIVYGLGFMAEIDAVPGLRYSVQWWQRAADQTFDRDYSHQVDPARDDFYDYAAKPYMTKAREAGVAGAYGPYIDHGGADDYLVTVSVPVMSALTFVGIVAADVRVASLERALSRWLAQAPGTCVVLNSESRVLLSNSACVNVGDVVADAAGLARTSVGLFDWVIGSDGPGYSRS